MWEIYLNFMKYVFILLVAKTTGSLAMCSSLYGAIEPCSFVPAPPGHTPPCARPGDTFCEHVDRYPMQQIRYLIDKWGYDYSSLFSDEIHEEFTSYFVHPDYNYGHQTYSNSLPPNTGSGYSYPEPIYIPKPPVGAPLYPNPPGNKYIPPPVAPSDVRANYTDGFQGYPDRRQKYQGTAQNGVAHGVRGHHHGYFMPTQGGYYSQGVYYDPNSWWRYARDNKNLLSRTKRSTKLSSKFSKSSRIRSLNTPTVPLTENTTESEQHHRDKRQSVFGGPQQLCPTRSQFIMPQAALNNKGNWMYVVNLQEQEGRFTQLVKSESCMSQTCSGICSVPSGYTARCEQRYVQKRLVALEGAGQNLYTDVFWFPSCCVCTFTTG